jgi:hypothetical protein
MLEITLKESIDLLNLQYELSQEFNLNDFNPNENRIQEITNTLKELDKIVEGLQGYINMLKNKK